MDLNSRTSKELETLERFEFLLQLIYFHQLGQPKEWNIQFSTGLISAGNTALGALLFGQAFTQFNFILAIFGLFIWVGCYICARIILYLR